MTEQSADMFARFAPHLSSMMGASFEVELDASSLSAEERDGMIVALETWSGMSSAELVRRAVAGDRPGGADYVAWPVLLGRGDLL